MTSILPGNARTPWDVIGSAIGTNLSQNLPGAVQQGYQRQLGLNALDQAQQEIAQAGGDPYKIALAFARAGAQNPSLERSLGPLLQTALQSGKVGRAFGPESMQPATGGATPVQQLAPMAAQVGATGELPQEKPATPTATIGATPGPFNIWTNADIDADSKRYAIALNDPNAAAQRYAYLQNQNREAEAQRGALEDSALKSGIASDELPRFMQVGSKFDPRNPSEWAQKTLREYNKVKSNDKKLMREFIPGIGSGLLGRDREKILKRMENTVQDQVKAGLEQETRDFLAENYLSPTEIESLIHPLSKENEKALKSLPKGIFPAEGPEGLSYFAEAPDRTFLSYEEAIEKDPKAMEVMQNRLADFFLKNVNPDTSLLVLRDKLWRDKNYDWRQIGPAIREAQQRGLKLDKFQSTELADIETQPPIQSLPDIFQSLDRFIQFFRGNK